MLKQIIPKNKTRLSELIREQTDLGHFQIQKIISGKSVKINGQRVNQDVVLKGDETVYIYIKDREKDKIDIVYQDKNVIAVNKPAGMEVTGEDSLAEKLELQHEDMKFFPVHRLDRNTTGLVIFALSAGLMFLRRSSKRFSLRTPKKVSPLFPKQPNPVMCR
jgi:pseudouridylate synthase